MKKLPLVPFVYVFANNVSGTFVKNIKHLLICVVGLGPLQVPGPITHTARTENKTQSVAKSPEDVTHMPDLCLWKPDVLPAFIWTRWSQLTAGSRSASKSPFKVSDRTLAAGAVWETLMQQQKCSAAEGGGGRAKPLRVSTWSGEACPNKSINQMI